MQERGRLFIEPGEEIYEGQIVGIHAKDNDLTSTRCARSS
jgi:GTP-binding protein